MARGFQRRTLRAAALAGLAIQFAALTPTAQAQGHFGGADCIRPDGALAQGETRRIASDMPASLAMELGEIERIEIDLDGNPPAAEAAAAPPMEICDPAGMPIAGEFMPARGGLVTLRFTSPAAGRYVLAVSPAASPRSITMRAAADPVPDVMPLVMGHTVFARLAPRAVRAWSFAGKAGQWVRVAAASEGGLTLRLVGPAGIAQGADDDTAEGRNPMLQHKLPIDGVWRVEVQSQGDAVEDMTLDVHELAAAPPPVPAATLRLGTPMRGTLESATDAALYEVTVRAGRSYQVEASAPVDLALDLGLPDPLEPAGGAPASGIMVQRTFEAPRGDSRPATFTAASDGRVLLRVRGTGIVEGGETFTVMLAETGG